ncbi:M12 family metallopeptidase [Tenacibaculum tangerinum]|uniref:M12 family metallopeptidase n=1 Tax=Tenacibaculum tangerinum TaxID=3038772 RepID=A0ABY8KY29_9FLAO|nr:M12 family metallopeptidase [Tenacibaculum tangerinum]WGH74153.1 M12 family metallopeptidase [Tenacibaculum tangerinum]
MSTKHHYCNLPQVPTREFSLGLMPNRLEAIIILEKKWVNGTKLKYYFFNDDTFFTNAVDTLGNQQKILWKGTSNEKEAVRNGFQKWMDLEIGLEFEETTNRLESHIRIGFAKGEGSWSYVGRDCWDISKSERTMNFGWNILNDEDTILHEIGHALGLPHEHQNPKAGIVWNETAVYNELAGAPNFWSREKTHYNIIRKINPDEVQGSNWDANSIMHYPFGAGLITAPTQFQNGIQPQGGLSPRDITWVKQFYPKIDRRKFLTIKPFYSEVFDIEAGQQVDFEFEPKETRNYTVRTFGKMDTVMVVSEHVNGEDVYLSGDDDSGEDYNSNIVMKFVAGKKYIINIRLYYKTSSGATCVMIW